VSIELGRKLSATGAQGGRRRRRRRNRNRLDYKSASGLVKSQRRENERRSKTDAKYNRINESSDFGSSTYTQNPDGSYQRTISMSPDQKSIYDNETKFNQTIGNQYNSAVNNLGNDFGTRVSADRGKYEQAFYDRGADLMKSSHENQKADFDRQMYERGIGFGSANYNKFQKDQITDPQSAEMSRLRNDAVLYGGQEAAQQMAQQQQARQGQLNDLGGLRSLSSGYQVGQYSPATQIGVQGVDVAGIGTNYANMDFQRSENAASRAHSAGQSAANRAHSAGQRNAANQEWYNRQMFQNDMQRDNAQWQAANTPRQKKPSAWGQVGSGIAQGIGQGLSSLWS